MACGWANGPLPFGVGGSSEPGAGPGLAIDRAGGPVTWVAGWLVSESVSTLSRHVRTRKMVNYAWPG